MPVISIHSHFAGLVLLPYKTKIRAKKQEFSRVKLKKILLSKTR